MAVTLSESHVCKQSQNCPGLDEQLLTGGFHFIYSVLQPVFIDYLDMTIMHFEYWKILIWIHVLEKMVIM